LPASLLRGSPQGKFHQVLRPLGRAGVSDPAGGSLARSPYFEPGLIVAARLVVVPRLENPDFYELFEEAGREAPIDFARMSALALVETILVVES